MSLPLGWYPDPDGDGERYHDGNRWTGVTRGGSQGSTPPAHPRSWAPHQKQTHRRRWIGVLVAAVVTIAVVAVVGPIADVAARIGIGGPERLLPEVHPAVASSAYEIAQFDVSGHAVTYDPCRAIHYVVNPAGAPPDYLAFILPAVNAAQEASGLKFEYDGISDETWKDHRRGGDGPVVIAFIPKLTGDSVTSETVGLGGSSHESINGMVKPHFTTGAVALKQGWFQKQSAQLHTAAEQAVVMHELGHVLGLAHVDDPAQLMAPVNSGQTSYGPGDLAGLAKLGSGSCGTSAG